MKILCIDFETANSFIGSICAMGIAIIEEGQITSTKSWFIRPHKDYFYFDSFNYMVHGISEKDVKDSKEFNEIYDEIKPLLEGNVLVAHNAAFDMSALRHVLQLYNISYPDVNYICTYKIALKVWLGLKNYKLNTVSKFLEFEFNHHEAEEDAIACAQILLCAIREKNVQNIFQLCDSIEMSFGHLYEGGYDPCSTSRFDIKNITAQTDRFNSEHEFFHKKVVFTGTLSSMTRKEAMQKVVNVGGSIGNGVTKDTNFLVMGIQDYAKFSDGKESSKTKKAKELILEGNYLQIIDEEEFLKLLQSSVLV